MLTTYRSTLSIRVAHSTHESTLFATHRVGRSKKFAMNGRQVSDADRKLRATSEILQVIRTSPIDVGRVFEAIAYNSVVLCESLFANVFRFDGTELDHVASHNVGPDYRDLLAQKYPMRPDTSQVSGRVILTGRTVWVEDVLADPNCDRRFPEQMGWRRMLGVPMLREETPIGTIIVGWPVARHLQPLADRQWAGRTLRN